MGLAKQKHNPSIPNINLTFPRYPLFTTNEALTTEQRRYKLIIAKMDIQDAIPESPGTSIGGKRNIIQKVVASAILNMLMILIYYNIGV